MIQAKILVLRFSSIGDIVLTSPVLRILQEQMEGGAEIHFVVKSKFRGVVQNNPRISKIFTFEKTIQEIIPELLLEEYDYIIDLQNNVRSRIIKKRLKTLSFSVDKRNFAKLLWIQFGIQGSIPHIVERYIATLKVLGLKDDGKGLEFYISESDQLPNPWGDYTAIPIGATYFGKKPDVVHWKEILSRIPGKKVLLGGKEDIEVAAQIAESLDVFNEVGKWNLAQSASLLKQAKLVVCGDTGLMHIASAFSKPIVSIWGCTRPNLGMSPWKPAENSVMILPKNRGERPCSKLGNKCKHGENDRCIHHIDLDELQRAVNAILL